MIPTAARSLVPTFLCAAVALTVFGACGAPESSSRSAVVGTVLKQSTHALSVGGNAASFEALDGTYGAGCTGRSGSWSTRIGVYAGTLSSEPLSVVENDGPGCVLTITAVQIGGATYAPTTTFALASTYADSAATFLTGGARFYANFKITPGDFSTDFAIAMHVSDDVNLVTGGATASSSPPTVAAPTITNLSPNQGPVAGGTTVTVTGTDLTSASAVSFGTTPATSFTVTSDTQIAATAPAGTGAKLITVTTPAGTSPGVAYTYVAAPVLTSFNPGSTGSSFGGKKLFLTGTGFTGVTAVSFGGTPATGLSPSGDTRVYVTLPAHAAGAVGVTVTTPFGVSQPKTFTYL